ncbi:transcriptional regulator [Bradyrhizobium sp. LTSPM299]|jgi:two-component system OmpR family response regulator|uniref:response regulator n=1 Tax=Bradyrhizobium sp. LTSPM299 TaxID=1619233 RepID=UPI0005C9FFD1|nr:response regulator [Bradyrhizobium sp. LTSPM299]KJC59117.1 transcriptional regulator [Bradyrhizobium sp. LTSPM299]
MLTSSPRILIVEDDQQTKDLIARYLRDQSCLVATASNGREMARYLAGHSLDLVILDLMLPGEDGLSLCHRLRNDSAIPIIILTAKGEDLDRILGLEMGADDYLSKPFNPRELLARINAVLRRQAGLLDRSGRNSARLRFQHWIIDLRLRELRDPEGAQVPLTSAEFDLLQAFCERPGRILTRDGLLSMTRSRPVSPFGRSIDVLVSRLRRKLDMIEGSSVIRTVRTGGYIFTPDVEDA